MLPSIENILFVFVLENVIWCKKTTTKKQKQQHNSIIQQQTNRLLLIKLNIVLKMIHVLCYMSHPVNAYKMIDRLSAPQSLFIHYIHSDRGLLSYYVFTEAETDVIFQDTEFSDLSQV